MAGAERESDGVDRVVGDRLAGQVVHENDRPSPAIGKMGGSRVPGAVMAAWGGRCVLGVGSPGSPGMADGDVRGQRQEQVDEATAGRWLIETATAENCATQSGVPNRIGTAFASATWMISAEGGSAGWGTR